MNRFPNSYILSIPKRINVKLSFRAYWMRHNFKLILILMFILILSCNSVLNNDNKITAIDLEANLGRMGVINLSELANNIQYIPLGFHDNSLLSSIDQVSISGKLILITNLGTCLLFDDNGHFIRRIGGMGRGPGEFQFAEYSDFGNNGIIYLQSLNDLLEYKIDGSFIRKYKNIFKIDNGDNKYLRSWLLLDDSIFFGHVPNTTGQIDYKAAIIDINGFFKQHFRNYIIFDRERPVSSFTENHANIYKFKNEIFYREYYNDTAFILTKNFEFIPKYVFKFGKFKEPLSERAKRPTEADISRYIYLLNVFQTDKYLFLDCPFGNYFPAKRLTQKVPPIPISNKEWGWYNTQSVLGIFNKVTQEIYFCKPTTTDNPLFTSGIYNDIDAGPRFFPKKQLNDSTLAMWVSAKELKDHVASKDFKNSIPKCFNKKKDLEELSDRLREIDNPVLMIVTFKR